MEDAFSVWEGAFVDSAMHTCSAPAAKESFTLSEKPKTSPSWWWSCDAPQPPCLRSSACHIHWGRGMSLS